MCSFKLGNELINIFRNASIGTTVIRSNHLCFHIFNITVYMGILLKLDKNYDNNIKCKIN
jgi:hypothetical protein